MSSRARIVLAIIASAVMAVAIVGAAKAEPEDGWRVIRRQFQLCDWMGCRHVWRDVRVRYYAAPRRDDDTWERRDPSLERGVSCKDDIVRVVGGLHLTKDGAINDAVRQWQSTVRYDFGERYMDIEQARGYVWRCDRAGTNETLAGRVGEAISGGNGFQRRCVVMARPCRMPMARGDKDER